MRAPTLLTVILAALAAGCGSIATAGPGCRPDGGAIELAQAIQESSGVAYGVDHPDVLWTHNDQGRELFALDMAGRLVATFTLPEPLRDWEDIEIATCAGGGPCLYLADTGDNGERRRPGSVRIVRVPEPDPSAPGELRADVFPIRYPDGPRDVEALFVLPGERPYVITKGRNDPITVYRYPPPLRADTVTLEEVQRLTRGSAPLLDQVTGASTSPDGSVVAVRTYQALQFYRVDGDTLASVSGGLVNLRTLQEIQGEGVGFGADGRVALTSEGGPLGGPPSLRFLRCDVSRL